MTELHKLVEGSGIKQQLLYGDDGGHDAALKAFAESIIDWVACQHYAQCREHRPIQNWILTTKRLLDYELLPTITAKKIEDHKWTTTESSTQA